MAEKEAGRDGGQLLHERGYYAESRSFALSIVSILPIVVLYHVGIVQSGYPVRNLAQVWMEGPLHLVGLRAAHVLNIALIIALVAVLLRSDLKGSVGLMTVVVMVAESAFYALALFKGGAVITSLLHEQAAEVIFAVNFNLESAAPLLLALGAGVYEELLFRLVLLGGGTLLLHRVFCWNRELSAVLALLVSAVLFAAAHHVGPAGEAFTTYNFLFRAVAGVLLGLIYLLRGFGVTVWTHALYNAMVVL